MDKSDLENLTDCKKCPFWRDYIGECRKPDNIDCPEGVQLPVKTQAETEYRSLA